MSTHECPAPGCSEQVPFERLACRPHWFSITPLRRARLLSLWARNAGSDEYFQARADCLRDLGVSEGDVADLNGGIA